jgi:hypothetical protein
MHRDTLQLTLLLQPVRVRDLAIEVGLELLQVPHAFVVVLHWVPVYRLDIATAEVGWQAQLSGLLNRITPSRRLTLCNNIRSIRQWTEH